MHTFYAHLWKDNIPARFWLPQPDFPSEMWETAYKAAYPLLELSDIQGDFEDFLSLTLGEARFGADHWRLSLPKRIYYTLKPILPRALTRTLRQLYSRPQKVDASVGSADPLHERHAAQLNGCSKATDRW